VDLHVSSYSTCSNEALAFGKPTILLSEQGLAIFREFVEEGIMFYAERANDFCEIAEQAFAVDPARLKGAGRSLFVVDENDASRAVKRVSEVVESQREKGGSGSISRKGRIA
jgi:predicted glycosyltransferase